MLSTIVIAVLSGQLFEKLIGNARVHASAFQKLRLRMQNRKVAIVLKVAGMIIVTIVIALLPDDDATMTKIIKGGVIGLCVGFFGALIPEHTEEDEKE
jgi:hypothetical protein